MTLRIAVLSPLTPAGARSWPFFGGPVSAAGLGVRKTKTALFGDVGDQALSFLHPLPVP